MLAQDALTQWVINYGYWAMFFGVVIEGPIITLLTGFLLSLGFFNIYYAYLILVFADILGDWLGYSIGFFGRKKALVKIFTWLQIPEEKFLDIEDFFAAHGGKSVFVSKFVAGAGSWTLISAGIGRMGLKKFFWNSLAAAIIKSALYLSVGFFFGGLYKVIAKVMNTTGTILTLILIAFILIWLFKSPVKNKFSKSKKANTKNKSSKKKVSKKKVKKN